MQLGREPHLGVDDAVGGQVLRAFGGHPDQRIRRLHDGDGVPEGVQVQLELAVMGRTGQPGGQPAGVGGREAGVAVLGRELDDRLRSQAAVEVIMQQHLRRAADVSDCERHRRVSADPVETRPDWLGRLRANDHRLGERLERTIEPAASSVRSSRTGCPAVLAWLGQADDPGGRGDGVLLPGPARAEAPGGDAHGDVRPAP